MRLVKTVIMKKILLLWCLLLSGSAGTVAQRVRMDVHPDTKMSISGTSTIHSWTSEVKECMGQIEMEEAYYKNGFKPGDRIRSVILTVPVKSIVSPRGAAMDKKTFEALKEDRFPQIRFTLIDNTVREVNGQVFVIEASGNLEIAGVKRTVTLTVNGKPDGNNRYQFTGSKKLNMREFDMEPPTAMFGQIVTGEEVEIIFTLIATKTN